MKQDTNSQIDALIRQRTGGAVNIRGIRFQILYTLARALQAHRSGDSWKVTPEGLEDVDVFVGGITEHVQVKTSKNRWLPHLLKKEALPSIVGAAQACGTDPTHVFTVLLSGPVNDRVIDFAGRRDLREEDRAPLDAELEKLLRKAGADDALAARLGPILKIRVLDEAGLADELRQNLVAAFGAHPASADVLIDALAAFVLDRARLRQPFGSRELARAVAAVAEGQTISSEFLARGRHLIAPIDWAATRSPEDFVDGRGTRAGHIAADLDVARPRWMKRIDDSLKRALLCVLRAPSGQGKSALAFRYARDHWDAEDTLVLHACSTPEDAAQTAAYLRARADLGIPTCLLIDGADWRLRHWPEVAAAARDRGIPTLVTVRVEDWRRFASGSAADLSSATPFSTLSNDGGPDVEDADPLADTDPVEPRLGRNEAQKLFRRLRSYGRIHPSVRSAEEAFEQVGEPPLLMEYLYLLTHGELLRHRLRGQLRELRRNHDDDHIAVLRLATLAHACGVSVPIDALADILSADPQRVLLEVGGEYVRLDGRDLAELHRVRSEHLAALLHEVGPSLTKTAVRLLPLLPTERLHPFAAGALQYSGIDPGALEKGLIELAAGRGPAAAVEVLDGAFEAGEREYVRAARPVFDRAFDLMGAPGPFLLASLLAPTTDPSISDGLIEIEGSLPSDAGERFRTLRSFAGDAPDAPRGYDRVRRLLEALLPRFQVATLSGDPGPSGRLLQEADRVSVRVQVVNGLLHELRPPAPAAVPDFASLVLGLYAHDSEGTRHWLRRHEDAIGEAAAEHLDLAEPPRLAPGPDGLAVEIEFYPSDEVGAPSLNDQAVRRLRLLRQLYPFAAHFRSRAHWLLPDSLIPTRDESVKDMIPRCLKPPLFRDRQGLWSALAQELFASPTFWAYQASWYELRKLAVRYAETVEEAVRACVEARSFNLERGLAHDDLENRFHAALRKPDVPPLNASLRLSEALTEGTRAWHSALENTTHQITQFVKTKNPNTGRLLRHNAHEVAEKVSELHSALDILYEVTPDHFDAHALRGREKKTYLNLAQALEFWTRPPVSLPVRSLRRSLREVHEGCDETLRQSIERTLHDAGIETALGPIVTRQGLSQVVVLALPLPHPCAIAEPAVLDIALRALAEMKEPFPAEPGHLDEVWFTLTVGGARFQREGFRFYSHQLHRLLEDGALNWEAFVLQPLPPDIEAELAPLPVRVSPVFEAWKVANSALMLDGYVEKHLAAGRSQHPRVHDRARAFCERESSALAAEVARVRVLLSNSPIDAADRLGVVASAVAQGEFPKKLILGLIEDLRKASTALGAGALMEA